MQSLKSTQHRYHRRSKERGITLFIVMAAILVLTGVGTWSLFSATMADQASGFSRASAQALYTSEMGVLAGSSYLSIPGYADANYSVATATPDDCSSVPSGKFCKSIYMEDLDPSIQTQSADSAASGTAMSLLDQSAGGSLGPYSNAQEGGVQADFVLEITEPRKALVEGTETSSQQYQRVTLTSYGIIRPGGVATLCTGDASVNAVATRMGTRAHMIIGPLGSEP